MIMSNAKQNLQQQQQQQQQFHTANMKSTMDDDLNQIVPDCIESISPKNPLLIHLACSFSFFFPLGVQQHVTKSGLNFG